MSGARHHDQSPIEGEDFLSFRTQSVHDPVDRRRREFVARGLASRDEARKIGEYFDAHVVQAQLRTMLNEAEDRRAKR